MAEQEKTKVDSKNEDKLPEPQLQSEVGVTYNLAFGSSFESAWEVPRYDFVSLAQLNGMRMKSPQVQALYNLIALPIRAALKTATFVPATTEEGGEEEAKFIEQMFMTPKESGGMTTPFRRVIAQLINGIYEGFAAFELVYKVPKNGPLKGKFALEKIAHRPASTITFLLDDSGEFAGFRQIANYPNRFVDKKIEPENCVYYTHAHEERAFYGKSMFLSAFGAYDKLVKMEHIAHLAAQRTAMGTRIAKVKRGASSDKLRRLSRDLSDMGVAQHIVTDEDVEVDVVHETPGFPFLDWLNYYNSCMSRAVLAPFFDKAQGGENAVVDFGQQTDAYFMIMLNTIMEDIEDVINTQIIPKFIEWNFKSDKYPKFRFGALSDDKKRAVLELFKAAMTAGQGYTGTPEFLLEMEMNLAEEHGFEIDYETVKKEIEKAKKMRQDMLEAQAAAGGTTAAGQLRGMPVSEGRLTPRSEKPEYGGKPGPDPDSVRTNKPANPANDDPTGKKLKAKLSADPDWEALYEEGLNILVEMHRELAAIEDANDTGES